MKIWMILLMLMLSTCGWAAPQNTGQPQSGTGQSSGQAQTGSGQPGARPSTGRQPGQSGNEWQSAWSNLRAAMGNVGGWFTRQYQTVQAWFAGNKQDLDQKVQDMVNFLGQVKQNANNLAQGANQQVQQSLQNVTKYYDDVVQFQNKLRRDTSANFQALENEWQAKVQNMYNGGLDKVINAAQTAKAANPNPSGQTGGTGSGK